ncbi:SecDF P1 head subdomain-containing protein, partial [Ferruginibacter sp.]|nr:protein translocase subunit SecDF [Ferruginibacter sp.]
MKLKGLIWFFTIALIIISLWELSYTWVVRSFESGVTAQATKLVKKSGIDLKDADALKAAVKIKKDSILLASKDKAIFPLVGTSYQKCKENELNLGLDLQGGISVTMDVSLEGLLKSLSNNSKDPSLLKAMKTATDQKVNSDADYISLFKKAFIEQNGGGKLSALFAGQGKEIKITDSDDQVTSKLSATAKGAIKETYKVLLKRIDKFGVAQPNINLDENKGIINVELAGVDNPDRVRKLLQASAHLQFWEVYQIGNSNSANQRLFEDDQRFVEGFQNANKALDAYKRGIDSTSRDTNALFTVMMPVQPQQSKDGKQVFYPAEIARVYMTDTSKFFNYINMDVVKNSFPANCKFLLGVEEKQEKGKSTFPVYAVKTQTGTERAPLEGEGVEEARQDYDEVGRPAIKMIMTPLGTRTWARLTGNNVGRPIAIALDDIVYSAPNVNGAIDGGNSEISGSFTVDEATDLANTLKSGKVSAPAKIVADQVVGSTLGEASIKGGMMSFGIAFLVIFILMLVYYNSGGWVANISLILNLLFT